jgi:hypothetical protein
MEFVSIAETLERIILSMLLFGFFFSLSNSLTFSKIYIFLNLIIGLYARFFPSYISTNLPIIYIIGCINLLFFSTLYEKRSHSTKRTKLSIQFSGIVLSIVSLFLFEDVDTLQTYVPAIFNLIIIGYVLVSINLIIVKKQPYPSLYILLDSVILLFFSIDFIIILTSNFLVNEKLDLVAPIWIFRQFVLILFYYTIIYFSWKTGKTQPH